MSLLKALGAGIALAILSGCASYPENVAVPEGTSLAEFSEISQGASPTVGQKAQWSGVIAAIKNEQQRTQLDILYYPAKSNGRPKLKDEPVGRFRAYVDGFLEPEVYKKGKSVTVLGELTESETGRVGDYEYLYPTLNNANIHLWKKLDEPARVEFYYGWHGPHPRWYWRGNTRHLYIIGGTKKKVNAVSPKKVKAN